MNVVFLGGPIDGRVQDLPDGSKLWIVVSPLSDPSTWRLEETDGAAPTILDDAEHAYASTDHFSKESGRRIFLYVGERARK